MKLAIFTDYDGTITAEDTIDLMLDTFGAADWLSISKKLDAAGATNLERMAAEFADFAGSIAQVEDLVREKIHIDETFKDFMAYARQRGWSLVVLSQGVRQSVETVFAKCGIEGVEWHANALVEADGRTSLSFPEQHSIQDGECSESCGVCKSGHIRQARRNGYTTVYIGDGITDRCPAAVADVIFAKRYLKKYLTSKGISFTPFETFGEIRDALAAMFPAEDGVKVGR
mgnify:CR=1 FL=1